MNSSAQVVVIHDVTFHEVENYGYFLGASISKVFWMR